MNYCPNCGYEIDPSWNNCPVCGTILKYQEHYDNTIWEVKRLPVAHICLSLVIIVIVLSSYQMLFIFLRFLPLLLVPVYLFFFNKNSFSIKVANSKLYIRPCLISRTKKMNLERLSEILITFTKKTETYNIGRNRGHTAILYFNIKIKDLEKERTYSFKRKWFIRKRYDPEGRRNIALAKRREFEESLKILENRFLDLIKVEDIATESTKARLVWQDTIMFFCFIPILIMMIYQSGEVYDEFRINLIITLLIILIPLFIIIKPVHSLLSKNINFRIIEETDDNTIFEENPSIISRLMLGATFGIFLLLMMIIMPLSRGGEINYIFYFIMSGGIGITIFIIIPKTRVELNDVNKRLTISSFIIKYGDNLKSYSFQDIVSLYIDTKLFLKGILANGDEFKIIKLPEHNKDVYLEFFKSHIEDNPNKLKLPK